MKVVEGSFVRLDEWMTSWSLSPRANYAIGSRVVGQASRHAMYLVECSIRFG